MSNFFKKINKMTGAYLIAEIGINHNGELDIAKELIDVAKDSGANRIALQVEEVNKVAFRTYQSNGG